MFPGTHFFQFLIQEHFYPHNQLNKHPEAEDLGLELLHPLHLEQSLMAT